MPGEKREPLYKRDDVRTKWVPDDSTAPGRTGRYYVHPDDFLKAEAEAAEAREALERELKVAEDAPHHWCHPSDRKPDGCSCGKTQRINRLTAALSNPPTSGRCPTCGSDDPKKRGRIADYGGSAVPEARCPDPYHATSEED